MQKVTPKAVLNDGPKPEIREKGQFRKGVGTPPPAAPRGRTDPLREVLVALQPGEWIEANIGKSTAASKAASAKKHGGPSDLSYYSTPHGTVVFIRKPMVQQARKT